jgi:hypothetical protein
VDVETSEAIEHITHGVVELRTELHDGLASVRAEIADLRIEIRQGVIEAKRYVQILHEDLKDDIGIVAEGVAHLSAVRDSDQQSASTSRQEP